MYKNKHDWPKAITDKNTKPYVFVSYSHADSEWVRNDLIKLSENAILFWYDEGIEPGEDWIERVKKFVNNDNCMGAIFFMSKHSVQSLSIVEEIEIVSKKAAFTDGFMYFSINFGGVQVSELLDSVHSSGHTRDVYEKNFDSKRLYIPRARRYTDCRHIDKCLQVLSKEYNKSIEEIQNNEGFILAPTANGCKIVDYRGTGEHLIIPSYIGKKKVVKIGNSAFKNKKYLKSVIISEGITEINDFAFSGCSSLRRIVLPKSLRSIGYEAFRSCTQIVKVRIPCNVSYIGKYCFYQCRNLEEAVFETGVEQIIGYACFSQCTRLKNVELSLSLIGLEDYVFGNCCFTEISIPKSVKHLGFRPFLFCTSLKKIRIEGFPKFDTELFKFCDVKKIYVDNMEVPIPESWRKYVDLIRVQLPQVCFSEYKEEKLHWYTVQNATAYEVVVNGISKRVTDNFVLLSRGDTIEVRALGDGIYENSDFKIFKANGEMWSYEMKGRSFWAARISDSIVKPNCFANNDSIECVVCPDQLVELGKFCFYQCSKIEFVNLNNVKKIGEFAFARNTALKNIFIENVSEIKKGGFSECVSLVDFEWPKIERIPESCFYRCISLKDIKLPEGLKEIQAKAFRGCMGVRHISLPESLETIGDAAFCYMAIEKIYLPKNLKSIGKDNFSECGCLAQITVASDNEVFFVENEALIEKNGTLLKYPPNHPNKKAIIPHSVTVIQKGAFKQSVNVESIDFNEGLREIEEDAFVMCTALKKLVLPSTLEKIGKNAFMCCTIEAVYLKSNHVEIGRQAFGKAGDNLKIYVKESNADIIMLPNWKYYKDNIVIVEDRNV